MSNILKKANEIVNERSEEKERQYGNFDNSMELCATIFNAMSGLSLSAVNMYQVMIAQKLARQKNAHKEDNLLDACAYIGAMNNYIENNAVDPAAIRLSETEIIERINNNSIDTSQISELFEATVEKPKVSILGKRTVMPEALAATFENIANSNVDAQKAVETFLANRKGEFYGPIVVELLEKYKQATKNKYHSPACKGDIEKPTTKAQWLAYYDINDNDIGKFVRSKLVARKAIISHVERVKNYCEELNIELFYQQVKAFKNA